MDISGPCLPEPLGSFAMNIPFNAVLTKIITLLPCLFPNFALLQNIQNMRFTIVFTAILIALAGCQNGAATQEESSKHTEEQLAQQEQKRQEIMAVHDAVMPEMSTLNRLSRTLKPLVQQDLSEDEKEVLFDVLKRLEQADEGMMTWMGEFRNNLDPLRDTMSHEAVMNYLQAEELKIAEVDQQIRSSMQAARELVEQYGLNKEEQQQ
jgi:hypothetical protein